jgi:hypothetical protein
MNPRGSDVIQIPTVSGESLTHATMSAAATTATAAAATSIVSSNDATATAASTAVLVIDSSSATAAAAGTLTTSTGSTSTTSVAKGESKRKGKSVQIPSNALATTGDVKHDEATTASQRAAVLLHKVRHINHQHLRVCTHSLCSTALTYIV